MTIRASAPWHAASFGRFLNDSLPALLAQRLPLGSYRVEPAGAYACRIRVAVSTGAQQVEAQYADVPRPDEDGIFQIDGVRRVVIPTASREELDCAEIRCVGEQLYDYVAARLGEAPADLPWDEPLLRSFLPLDSWVREFLAGQQELDQTNWLSVRTHLRRVIIPDRREVIAPGQFGRTCPFETPEGTNIGRVLSVALGAEVRDGRLVVLDQSPQAALGLTASMVPFLEHDDPNRLLMAVNMMRQWLTPPEPEPALVRTGHEPDEPGFWCGRNLLTAFISYGAETFEDGIVVSESAARRFGFPANLEVGDKLSNRHGSKGTVTRVLPDEQMPHLGDGTPVELVFSFVGLHTRLNFGQLREALASRLARAAGEPFLAPPFGAPSQEELRRRLGEAGLDESGMEVLTAEKNGRRLDRPSAVGWVYWGQLYHLALEKIHASVRPAGCQYQGWMEAYMLRDIGAYETIREHYNTRSADGADAITLADRVAAGPVEQAGPPSPKLADVIRRLAAGGIRADFDGQKMTFSFAPPPRPALKLACPVAHPWLRQRELSEVGAFEELAEYAALAEANDRLARLLGGNAPASVTAKAAERLQQAAEGFFDALLTNESPASYPGAQHVLFGNRVLFSGRAVLSVATDLRIDQVGLAEEIAWTIFAPLLQRELGDAAAVGSRTAQAAQALDRIMADSWVILNRAPTILPTSLLAFHAVRIPEKVIRLHPLCCRLMNADFDGDQAAVFLPITEAGQREASQRLTVAAHLRRQPELLEWLRPSHEALWGLAALSLRPGGLKEISGLAEAQVDAPDGFVTGAAITEAMRGLLDRAGPEAVLEALERLMRRGFEVAGASGASMSPFLGASLDRPPLPRSDQPDAWDRYAEELSERVASLPASGRQAGRDDYDDADLGPQLLAVRSGARGSLGHLLWLLGARGSVRPEGRSFRRGSGRDAHDRPVVRHGLAEGLTAEEMFTCTVGARQALGELALDLARQGYGRREVGQPKGSSVLARAMRAKHPGVVFAHAAAIGEVDPLADLDSRLFAGLPPRQGGHG